MKDKPPLHKNPKVKAKWLFPKDRQACPVQQFKPSATAFAVENRT